MQNQEVTTPVYKDFKTSFDLLYHFAEYADWLVLAHSKADEYYNDIIISEEEPTVEIDAIPVLKRFDRINLIKNKVRNTEVKKLFYWARDLFIRLCDSIPKEEMTENLYNVISCGKQIFIFSNDNDICVDVLRKGIDVLLSMLKALKEYYNRNIYEVVYSVCLIELLKVIEVNEDEQRFIDDEMQESPRMIISKLLEIYKNTELEEENRRDYEHGPVEWPSHSNIERVRNSSCTVFKLGDYDSKTRNIILYAKNIAKEDPANKDNLLQIVFLRELVHACLHPIDKENWCGSFLEAPMAEYGMLIMCRRLWKAGCANLVDYAVAKAYAMQENPLLFHYAFGLYLFMRMPENFLYLQTPKLLTKYIKAKIKAIEENDMELNALNEICGIEFLGVHDYPCETQEYILQEILRVIHSTSKLRNMKLSGRL